MWRIIILWKRSHRLLYFHHCNLTPEVILCLFILIFRMIVPKAYSAMLLQLHWSFCLCSSKHFFILPSLLLTLHSFLDFFPLGFWIHTIISLSWLGSYFFIIIAIFTNWRRVATAAWWRWIDRRATFLDSDCLFVLIEKLTLYWFIQIRQQSVDRYWLCKRALLFEGGSFLDWGSCRLIKLVHLALDVTLNLGQH